MIDVSDDACELLLGRLQDELVGRPELRRRPVPPGLKLFIREKGAHLSLGFPSMGDEVVTYQGKPLLIIAAKDLHVLAGTCLLVRQNGGEGVLALERTQD